MKYNNKDFIVFIIGVFAVFAFAGLNPKNPANSIESFESRYSRLATIAIAKRPLVNYQNCSFWRDPNTSLIPPSFVKAIVTVENYGRPPLRRWLETILAKNHLLLTGKLPNYSLGIGQVKVSTAKLLIERQRKDSLGTNDRDLDMFNSLLNPCENLNFVHQYLIFLIKDNGFDRFNKESAMAILGDYNGQAKNDRKDLTYQAVVWKVFCLQNQQNQQSVCLEHSDNPPIAREMTD